MPSIPSRFRRAKYSQQPQKTESVKPVYASHHATVNCHECNRTMVPRVVSYYGQPLKSICPFCGTTFMKFPSGLQRFLQNFHTRTLSFDAFKLLAIAALTCGLFWLVSVLANFTEDLTLIAVIGTSIFGVMALAELIAQSIEFLALKFSHESNYYWFAIVFISAVTANLRHELTDYIILFFAIMFIRWIFAGFAQARNATKSCD